MIFLALALYHTSASASSIFIAR